MTEEVKPQIWTCHAVPAATGRTCGHVNASGVVFRGLVCCESCGCTRTASEDRQRRAGGTP